MTTRDPRFEAFAAARQGTNDDQVARRFDQTAIVIETDAAHAVLAVSVANLAARLWPNTQVVGPSTTVSAMPLAEGPLEVGARTLIERVRLSDGLAPERTISVALGVQAHGAALFATTDTWSLRVSRQPVDMLDGARGPATSAAAALIVSELFRLVLPEMSGVRLTEPFEWNLFDYRRRVVKGPDFGPVQATCFGAGSVGSSLVLSLLLADATGTLELVDDDHLQTRNRLRYPMWVNPASGSKVDWVAAACRPAQLKVVPLSETAEAYVSRSERSPVLAVSTVDTVSGRAAIADLLARETVNAGVDGLQAHVARHRFGDDLACVYCSYVDAKPIASERDVYVALSGLRPERVERLLAGERLSTTDVAAMVASRRLGSAEADELVGGRLADVGRARLYAEASLEALGGVRVAAPFVSALVGAVLAAELLKPREHGLDRRVDLDLSGWPTGLTSRPKQEQSGRCLCWSPIRNRSYAEAWAAPPVGG